MMDGARAGFLNTSMGKNNAEVFHRCGGGRLVDSSLCTRYDILNLRRLMMSDNGGGQVRR